MSRIPQDEVRPLSYLEVLDEENQALTGSEPSHEDLRLREDYRRALGTGSAESAEPTRKYRRLASPRNIPRSASLDGASDARATLRPCT